jgi:hypothetical protein
VTPEDPCPDAPYSATLAVLDEQQRQVALVTSGEDGLYRVALGPGSYTILPQSPPEGLPAAPPVEAEVVEGRWTRVDIAYDTGIR